MTNETDRNDDTATLTCPNCGRSKVSDSIGHRHTGAQCFWCGFSTDRNDSAATPQPPLPEILNKKSRAKKS
jgi:transcription elongation factor Elf1